MPPEPAPKTTDTTGPPSWMAPVTPVVPDHELIRRIGGGSYGDVWLARTTVGTWRAVKVVFRDRFTDARPYEREFNGIQKFEPLSRGNEAFIDILQIGRNDAEGYFYYVMELADDANAELGTRNVELPLTRPAHTLSPTGGEGQGEGAAPAQDLIPHSALRDPHSYVPKTLAKVLLQRGRLSVSECLELGLTLNLGLAQLHRAGLIHRDIKPSNIIFVGGVPKLADIGLVIELAEARSFVGTEGFIPPEGPNSPQADLYSLGKVLYEAGMGKDRKDFPEPYTQIAEAPDAAALLEFNAILLKACAANRDERYQSAEEMNADLALLQSGGSVRGQRKLAGQLRFVQRAGALITVLAAVIALGWWWQAKQTRVVRELAAQKSQLAEEKTRLAEENRQRLVRLGIANGVHLLDEGDPAGALLWFADALPQLTNNPAEESIHRIRIQQALNQIPRPTQVLAHDYPVKSMAFSPDGKRMATGTESGWLQVWDTTTGELLWKPLRLPGDAVRQLGFTPDGQRLFASTWPDTRSGRIRTNTATVVDVDSGQLRLDRTDADSSTANFTPDGRWLVTAGADHVIRVIDVRDGRNVSSLPGHTDDILAFAFSADGNRLASSSRDQTIRLWRLPSGEQVGEPFRIQPGSHPVILSGDGQRLAACQPTTRDGVTNSQIVIRETQRGQSIGQPIEIPGGLIDLTFDPATGRKLHVLSAKQVQVFDADKGTRLLQTLKFDKPAANWDTTPDGRRLIVAGPEGVAGLWDLDTSEALAPPLRHGRQVSDIKFSPDGLRFATTSDEGACVIWRASRRPEDVLHQFNANIARLAPQTLLYRFSPDRRRFLIILSDATVRLVDTERLEELDLPGPRPTNCAPHQCTFAPDNRQWAIAYASEEVRLAELWREEGGARRRLFLPHPTGIGSMRFSPDSERLTTRSDDRLIRIWSTADGSLLKTVPIPESFEDGEHFPDGHTVLFRSQQGFVLYDLATGTVIQTAIPPVSYTAFAFDSPRERFVMVTERQWGRVWSSRTGEPLTPPVWHGGPLTWVDWSLDGKRILMSGTTPEAKVWDAASGELQLPALRIGDAPIVTAMFSLDGRFIVARSDVGAARVWDAATGEAVTPQIRHGTYLRLAHLVANNRLITISLPNKLRAWDLKESALTPAVLADYARLASGWRLNPGGVLLPLKPDELAALRRSLAPRAPELFP